MSKKREQKKSTILGIAQQFFSRFGLNRTTMDEIAKAARIGKATLYHYFQDKEQLFYEVIKQESGVMKSTIDSRVEQVTDSKDRLKLYISIRLEHLNKFVNTYSALRDDYMNNLSLIKKFRDDFNSYEKITLSKILNEGIKKGIFIDIKVSDVIQVFMIALRGLELYLITERETEISDKEINLLTETMLYGICG
jgi:AcrR family transcriptional regulator